jgi:CHAT domain-containing protein
MKRLLAMANPIHPGWAALSGSEAEVRAVSAHFEEKRIFARDKARKAELKGRDLRGWHLHLALHGTAGDVDETRLVFSDGYLNVQEIWGLYLEGAPMVVLSACETQIGEQISGDEVVSLANGFLFSGAESVVSSLWQVPDEGTRQLMKKFYALLGKGKSKTEALALAQRNMIQSSQWSHPGFWAGFVINGY